VEIPRTVLCTARDFPRVVDDVLEQEGVIRVSFDLSRVVPGETPLHRAARPDGRDAFGRLVYHGILEHHPDGDWLHLMKQHTTFAPTLLLLADDPVIRERLRELTSLTEIEVAGTGCSYRHEQTPGGGEVLVTALRVTRVATAER